MSVPEIHPQMATQRSRVTVGQFSPLEINPEKIVAQLPSALITKVVNLLGTEVADGPSPQTIRIGTFWWGWGHEAAGAIRVESPDLGFPRFHHSWKRWFALQEVMDASSPGVSLGTGRWIIREKFTNSGKFHVSPSLVYVSLETNELGKWLYHRMQLFVPKQETSITMELKLEGWFVSAGVAGVEFKIHTPDCVCGLHPITRRAAPGKAAFPMLGRKRSSPDASDGE